MKESGFTLVELLITVVVAIILTGLAIPAFLEMIQNNRVVTHTNDLVTALNLARSESVRRNESVRVSACDTSDGCTATGTNWSMGWVVWQDADGDDPAFMDDGEQLRIFRTLESNLSVTGPAAGVAFTSTGAADAAACFGVAATDATVFRRVELNLTGGVVVDRNVSCP
jgi:type IV fimbrial biogenesis protein FimT